MESPLGLASFGLFATLAGILILFVVVFVKTIKAVNERRQAKQERGGEAMLLSLALQDALTLLKQQERAMAARAEASEQLADQIVEGLTSGLVVVDRSGMIQVINPAARRILEIGEAAGSSFRDVLAPAPALSDLIAEALEGTSPIVRRTVTLAGERPRHLGVTVSPIAKGDGGLQAAVCLFTDLTEVVELEHQLQLKEALARLGELTAGLAHEFRNGLATIHGYGRLLDPDALPDQARTCVIGIRSETVALGEVVTNFLRFARPEQLTVAPVDLRAVITRAVDDVPNAAPVALLEGTFPMVSGDDVLLRQAFTNLVRNSMEACEGRAPRITVRSSLVGDEAQVIVEDNGPGFTPESLRKVFQPFATTKANGTGLGLAIVQKVIVSHNGRITAANRADGGAQFLIRLPLARS